MKVNVLTANSCPNSRAFNFPLLLSRRLLKSQGIDVCLLFSTPTYEKHIFESDILCINSFVFKSYWLNNRKSDIFRFLETAKKNKRKVIWFDTTDSTWCTQFEVMPFADKFAKSVIFADKRKYLTNYRTGRIFTDFFDGLYNSGERDADYPCAKEEELDKIVISWNTCFENYTLSRFGFLYRLKQFLRPFLSNITEEKIIVDFTSPRCNRYISVSYRVGLSHSRPSVVAHRKAIYKHLEKYFVRYEKISLRKYFCELQSAKIAIGPFGVGEITLRDYEIIICGALLLKPDMTHLKTWPELFIPHETYIPFQWDLSDLREKIELFLADEDRRIEIAHTAQKKYQYILSEQGINVFAERFKNLIFK